MSLLNLLSAGFPKIRRYSFWGVPRVMIIVGVNFGSPYAWEVPYEL